MYPIVYQKGMTAEKWCSYPRFQQLLFIANELNRAQNLLIKADFGGAEHAWERAFELTDLTLEGDLSRGLQKELLRFRELLGEIFITHDTLDHKKLIAALIMLDARAFNMMNGDRQYQK